MAHAYTPGLRVTDRTIIRKRRVLPIKGKVVAAVGAAVRAETVVATTELPGKVQPVNVVNLLGITPGELADYMLKKEGEKIEKGEPIAENRPFIKWFKTQVPSPIAGSIETISKVTGQVLLREPPRVLDLLAYFDGRVVEVHEGEGVTVETRGAFLQGIFGIGGETYGEIAVAVKSPDEELTPAHLKPEHKGKVVIGGAHAGADLFAAAKKTGVAALVVGGIHDKDLKELLGYDLGVAITGTERVGFTLVVTEGFGRISMARRTFELLSARVGRRASVSGATQIRAGVIRPEIIIPETEADRTGGDGSAGWERGALRPGDPIRVIRDPLFGLIGRVKALPHEPRKIATEATVRILEVEFPDGRSAVIPRSNVELIEE